MATVRFATGWRRFCVAIGYHHVLMFILAVAIAFFAILLAGCTSNSSIITSIYLLSVSYQQGPLRHDSSLSNQDFPQLLRSTAKNATLEVRSGYFMLCVTTDPREGVWECSSNTAALARTFGNQDPLNLIDYSSKFISQVVFYGLILGAIALAAISIVMLSTFPGWHTEPHGEDGSEHEVKPFPSRAVSQAILSFLGLASLLAFVSILWQHIATAAVATSVGTILEGAVVSHVGASIMVFGWIGLAILVVASLGILVMILSVQLLDLLVDED